MRILGVIQGHFGERKVETWRKHGPSHWEVLELRIKGPLPAMMEDPREFVPPGVPQADLVVSLGEEPGVAELLPEIVKASGARAVIVPVDNRAWVPPGLGKQLERTFSRMGVASAFPVPFCALKESDSEDPLIREFAQYFGLPEVELEVEGERIKGGRTLRSAPCGSTYFVVENLRGERVQDAEERAGILHHNYPCLATMNIDWQFQDTLMHRAGYLVKDAVKRALKGRGR